MDPQRNDVFISLPAERVPGLKHLFQGARELATVPDEVDVGWAERQFAENEDFKARRDEVYHPPEEKRFLRREAEYSLKRDHRSLVADSSGTSKQETTACSRSAGGVISWDIDSPAARSLPLREQVSEMFQHDCRPLGDQLYPPRSYRDWHSNKFDMGLEQCWVMFLVYSDRSRESFFRYRFPADGTTHTVWDDGATVNFFFVSKRSLLWHCIASETAWRWSHGFELPDNWRERLELLD